MKLSLTRTKLNPEPKKVEPPKAIVKKETTAEVKPVSEVVIRPSSASDFASMVAREIVKTLSFQNIRLKPFTKDLEVAEIKDIPVPEGEHLILVDTSVLIDGRILPIVQSGFMAGTLLVPQFVLQEIQHISDSSDSVRRAKGRRGLEVVNKLKTQKANELVALKIINDDVASIPEVDHKLVALAKQWKTKLLTVDFNLAQLARAQGISILNIQDLANAIKLSLMPGEELKIKITHEGKEKEQGVGYLADGTMVVVDGAKTRVNQEVEVVLAKIHQTQAGQLFFARLK